MLFRDSDLMEGILPNNLLQIDPYGFSFVPPDPFSNNQRIFVPREALRDIHVLGVVGGKAAARSKKAEVKDQIKLFE